MAGAIAQPERGRPVPQRAGRLGNADAAGCDVQQAARGRDSGYDTVASLAGNQRQADSDAFEIVIAVSSVTCHGKIRPMKVYMQWLFAFIQLAAAVEAAADSGRQDVVTLISQCEGRTRGEALAAIVQACTSAIDTKAYQGKQLGMLYLNRANVYDSMGDSSNALLDYNKAVELAPDVAGTYYNRGVFYKARGDLAAALKDNDSALRLDPTFVPALYNRAVIYTVQNNISGALADYSQAIRLSPNTAELHGHRGFVYLMQGDYQNALKDEDEAIRLDPKYAVAYLYRATAHGKLGDGDQAVEDTKTAIRLNPSLASNVGINGVRLNSGRATSTPQPEPK